MDRPVPDFVRQRAAEPEKAGEVAPPDHEAAQFDDMKPVPPFRPNPLAIILLIVVMAALIAAGALPRYFQERALLAEKHAQLSEAPSVSYVVAKASPATQDFVLPGSTEAILTAPVYARVNGYLHLRSVNIGDLVHAGQLLGEIETPEIDKQLQSSDNSVLQAKANLENSREALSKAQADQRTATANVEKAKSDLSLAKIEFNRYDELAKTGAVSMEDRDTRLTAFTSNQAALESMIQAERSAAAQVRASIAGVTVAQSALAVAESNRGEVAATRSFQEVKAPFDGVITERNVDPGALITSGSSSTNTVLFSVAKTDTLRIYVYVPEQYISDIQVGQRAGLTVEAYPTEKFYGTVAFVAGGLDPNSRTLQVEIHVPNKNHRLLPGMYAQVHFQSKTEHMIPIVPSAAVQFLADGSFIYTIDQSNCAQKNKVEIARDLGGAVEILRGVPIGAKVIVSPPDDMVAGKAVNPVLQRPPTAPKG